jgi:hypothetical protein
MGILQKETSAHWSLLLPLFISKLDISSIIDLTEGVNKSIIVGICHINIRRFTWLQIVIHVHQRIIVQ